VRKRLLRGYLFAKLQMKRRKVMQVDLKRLTTQKQIEHPRDDVYRHYWEIRNENAQELRHFVKNYDQMRYCLLSFAYCYFPES
jgi:hypothetical protein